MYAFFTLFNSTFHKTWKIEMFLYYFFDNSMTMKSSFSTYSTSPVLSRLQHALITILKIYEPENVVGHGGNSWVLRLCICGF